MIQFKILIQPNLSWGVATVRIFRKEPREVLRITLTNTYSFIDPEIYGGPRNAIAWVSIGMNFPPTWSTSRRSSQGPGVAQYIQITCLPVLGSWMFIWGRMGRSKVTSDRTVQLFRVLRIAEESDSQNRRTMKITNSIVLCHQSHRAPLPWLGTSIQTLHIICALGDDPLKLLRTAAFALNQHAQPCLFEARRSLAWFATVSYIDMVNNVQQVIPIRHQIYIRVSPPEPPHSSAWLMKMKPAYTQKFSTFCGNQGVWHCKGKCTPTSPYANEHLGIRCREPTVVSCVANSWTRKGPHALRLI